MTGTFKHRPLFMALAVGLLCAGPPLARAEVTALAVAPGSATINVPEGSAFTVTWSVTSFNNTGGTLSTTVVSSFGKLKIGATEVRRINRVLTRTVTIGAGLTAQVNFTETVLVPRDVAFQMAKNPNLTTVYSRTFEDASGVSRTASVSLVPGGRGSAGLAIRRLDLSFLDQSRVKVLPEGEDLMAVAEIRFAGSGPVQLEWQVAGPTATRGKLVFRRLKILRHNLSGGRSVSIRSPRLPTAVSGFYQLRLVVKNPDISFEEPVLHYVVNPRPGVTSPPTGYRVSLIKPVENATLTAAT